MNIYEVEKQILKGTQQVDDALNQLSESEMKEIIKLMASRIMINNIAVDPIVYNKAISDFCEAIIYECVPLGTKDDTICWFSKNKLRQIALKLIKGDCNDI